MSRSCISFVLILLSSFVLFTKTFGHGLMCTPRQRGAYQSADKCGSTVDVNLEGSEQDFCPHCLNGGSASTVKSNLPSSGWTLYDPIKDPASSLTRATLCGDALGNPEHMENGKYVPDGMPRVSHYRTGSAVDFSAELDTNHNGYFEFFLCNLDACGVTDIAKSCFENGHCYRLLRVKHPDCESSASNEKMHYECGPIDDVYPGRWYVPCRKTGHVGVHVVGGDNGYMRYKLPDGVKCEHCIVQWYWATANSCAPRGLEKYMHRLNYPFGKTCAGDGGAAGTFREGMSECGGSSNPEEFWSCADVKISDSGDEGSTDTTGTTTSTTTTTTTTTNPTTTTEEPSATPSVTPSLIPNVSPSAFPSASPSASLSASPSAISAMPPMVTSDPTPIVTPEAPPIMTPDSIPTVSPTMTPSVVPMITPDSTTAPDSTTPPMQYTDDWQKQQELLKKQKEEEQQKYNKSMEDQKDEIEKQKKMKEDQQQSEDSENKNQDQGNCVAKGDPCDGSVKCCDSEGVCVYRSDLSKFECLTWDDVQAM